MEVSHKRDNNTSISKKLNAIESVIEYLTTQYEFRYNEISEITEYKQTDSDSEFVEVNESDLFIELLLNSYSIAQNKLSALLVSKHLCSFYNPFEDYFLSVESLTGPLDHESEIDKLCSYIVLKNEEDRGRFNLQFKKHLVRSIACALEEGKFNKQIFTLVSSKQSTGKSTFIRFLCPQELKEFYTENFNFHDKDSQIAITENFIINLDELSQLEKADVNKLKAIVSKESDKNRRSYGNRQKRRTRRASFFASTNRTEFIDDETGSVRWLCFEIDSINWKYKKKVSIKKVWSEAYNLYKSDFIYEMSIEEIKENEFANHRFKIQTREDEIIMEYFTPGNPNDFDVFLQGGHLAQLIMLHFPPFKTSPVMVGRSLQKLGFERNQMKPPDKNHQVKGYHLKINDSRNGSDTFLSKLLELGN